jgi:hypothetical protein
VCDRGGLEAAWYDVVGHTVHLEQPDHFNRELAELVAGVGGLLERRTAAEQSRD